jgi:hypothetical protein
MTDTFTRRDPFDLDNLLHPGRAFESPDQVVNDPYLALNEKRAILASWASDACAVEAAPELRQPPPAGPIVKFDDIMDALRKLDGHMADSPRYSKLFARARRLKDIVRTRDGSNNISAS